MDGQQWLAERFAEHRGHLRAVAYRMLGSLSEADDALQEAWLRADRAHTAEVRNLAGWLTTIVARVCLNMLRSRAHRQEEPLDTQAADPLLGPAAGNPEAEVEMADSVGGGAAGGARQAEPGRAGGVRAARSVRGAVRGDRPLAGTLTRGDPAAGQPGASPGQGGARAAP
ncbi:hypothetical protein GCM10020001_034210 [Nonomuraea salmonea]